MDVSYYDGGGRDEELSTRHGESPFGLAMRTRGRIALGDSGALLPSFTEAELDELAPMSEADWKELRDPYKSEPSNTLKKLIARRIRAARQLKWGVNQ